MEDIVATLTHEQQAVVRSVPSTGIAALGTSLARIVSIHRNCHTTAKRRLIGDVAVQLGKGPLGGMPVRFALLAGDRFIPFSLLLALVGTPDHSFADVGQVLQADDAVWVLVYDAPTDAMVRILFQPSLSSTDHHQTAGRGTSAFL